MRLDLKENEIKVLLNALIENIAFDNEATEIKELYNKILSESKIEGFEKI